MSAHKLTADQRRVLEIVDRGGDPTLPLNLDQRAVAYTHRAGLWWWEPTSRKRELLPAGRAALKDGES